MALNRIGSKQRIAELIYSQFPAHDCYIEPFFGAGGMFFKKPKSKYNCVNDLDNEVYNFFKVIINKKEKFLYFFDIFPIHNALWQDWKKSKRLFPAIDEDVEKAVRFLFYSNFGLFGDQNILKMGIKTPKKQVRKKLNKTIEKLENVFFSNKNYKEFLNSISLYGETEKDKSFIYADPPYWKTANNYSDSFTFENFKELVLFLINYGVKFAISEYKRDETIEFIKQKNLNWIEIKTLQSIKNRNIEILITNYDLKNNLFFNLTK